MIKNKIDKIESLTESLLKELGENPEREGLIKTPSRVAKSWEYLSKGYTQNIETLINNAIFSENYDQMVVIKDIEFYSMCEHHLLPFFGHAHIAYIPDGKIIGLSKIPRLVDMFARRLQVQERMTQEIAVLAEKRDISEEITRFKAHSELFIKFLNNSNNQVGKKMNFLLQEMGREVNTIGSKTDLTQVSHIVVDLKNEIEKIREQVQNIL